MTLPVEPSRMPNAVSLYLEGESVLALSKRFGVSRDAVTRLLKVEGVTLRTPSEQNRIAASRQSPGERKARAAAANAAARGVPQPESRLVKSANTRATKGAGSEGEARMLDWLTERGENPGIQTPIGRYNADFTLSGVAVELLGGEWHRYKRYHRTRTKAILDAGWHVLFVWDTPNYPVRPDAADYVVTFAEFSRLNPSAIREYRVIRGDGEFVASGRVDTYDLTLIPTARSGMSASEIGKLGAKARWG